MTNVIWCSLTIVEGIINYVIDSYRTTFLCFVQLLVQGALSLLIAAVQEVSKFASWPLR
jgi:hypothetical protein